MTDDNVTNINEAKPNKPEPEVITVNSNQWKSDLLTSIKESPIILTSIGDSSISH